MCREAGRHRQDLIRGPADTTSFQLHLGTNIINGPRKDLQDRLFSNLLLHNIKGAVDDTLGGLLFATDHDNIHKAGHQFTSEFRSGVTGRISARLLLID